MPGSLGTFNAKLLRTIARHAPKTLLDIGPGYGKVGRIAKRAMGTQCKIRLVAVEPCKPYIEKLHLTTIYDEIVPTDALTYAENTTDLWDMIVLGDVIEHLPWSRGMDLLQQLSFLGKRIVVITPQRYPLLAENPWDRHRSSWIPSDFERWDGEVEVVPVDTRREQLMLFASLKGWYQDHEPSP